MKAKITFYLSNLKNKLPSVLYRKFLIAGVFLPLFLFLVMLFTPGIAAAESGIKKAKIVTSVKIAEGDSLWSLAKTFYTAECGSFSNYMEEIKKSNGMTSDTLYKGNYIIIPYYADSTL